MLKTGYDWVANSSCKTHTVMLADGERVIGYKSSGHATGAEHFDFQLVIARLV